MTTLVSFEGEDVKPSAYQTGDKRRSTLRQNQIIPSHSYILGANSPIGILSECPISSPC